MPPLILGHRGARVSPIPENTFAAFDYCLAAGCDGFEFDVRLTGDGRALVCHDEKICDLKISQSRYTEIIERWTATRSVVGFDLCLLEEVLRRYSDRAFLDIELKVEGLTESVVAVLEQHAPQRGYVVSSFLPSVLSDLHEADKTIPLGLIADREKDLKLWSELPVEYVIPHQKLVTPALLEDLHERSKKVLVWTVNRTSDMRQLKTWGVDGIVADDPKRLRATLGL